MTSPALRTGLIVLAAIVAVALYASTFTVSQTQQALVLQLGRVRAVLNQNGTDSPGLYFKWPFIETVVIVDKRVLDLDLPVQTLLSADRQNLEVDAFARYRITDPLRFYQSVNTIALANQRLASFTNASMRNVLARASREAIVKTERARLMNQIQDEVNLQAKNLGVEFLDLRLTRVDLPATNSQAVYQRMQSERQREAADIRANGNQMAATTRAKTDRDVTVLIAESQRRADEARGQGDADKNRILAQAFGQDPAFFQFYRSLQVYESSLKGGDTRLVLSPNSELFRFFIDAQGRGGAAAGSAAPAR